MKQFYFTLTSLFILVTLFSYSQGVFTHYTPENTGNYGFINPIIKDIVEANDGKIWLCTDDGITVLDGNNKTHIRTNEAPSYINCTGGIAKDNNGAIWIAGCGELTKFDGSIWKNYNQSNSNINVEDGFEKILVDGQNRLWISGSEGVYRYNESLDEFTAFTKVSGHLENTDASKKAFAIDNSRNEVWVASSGGTHVRRFDFSGNNVTTFSTSNGLADINDFVIYKDFFNNIWIGGCCSNVSKYDGSSFTNYSIAGTIGHAEVFGEDNAGNLWLAGVGDGDPCGTGYTYNLARFNGTDFSDIFNSGNGLYTNSAILEIYGASNGNLYLGFPDGLSIYNGTTFTNYENLTSLSSDRVNHVFNDSQNRLWYGETLIGYYQNGQFKNFNSSDNYASKYCRNVQKITETQDGNIWVAEGCDYPQYYDGSSWAHLSCNAVSINGSSSDILQIDNSTMYIASSNGIMLYNYLTNTEVQMYNQNNSGLVSNEVRSLSFDQSGNLWAATNNGISKFDGSNWTTYNTSNTLNLPVNNFMTSYNDSQNNLWFGCDDDSGVVKYNGSAWSYYSNSSGELGGNYVDAIFEDSKGNMWFGHTTGATKYDGSTWKIFHEGNGFTSEYVQSITERNDTIWLAADDGLWAYYEPEPFTEITTSLPQYMSIYTSDLIDYDNDGDLDVFIGGSEGTSGIARIYQNNGNNNFVDLTSVAFRDLLPISYTAWGDYNNDGFIDVLLAGGETGFLDIKLFSNSNGAFSEVVGTSFRTVTDAHADWGDYDNDGDLDLVMFGYFSNGDNHHTWLYENMGAGKFTEYQIFDSGLDGEIAWGDYDNDNDLDLLAAMNSASSGVNRNDGKRVFTRIDNSLIDNATGAFNGSVNWGDYDGDGDLDFAYTSGTDEFGATRLYGSIMTNNGNDSFTELTTFIGVTGGDIKWGDYDNDGDLDLAFCGRDASSNLYTKVYTNENGTFVENRITDFYDIEGNLEWADLDNDGDLDYLVYGGGAEGQKTKLYQNNSLTPNTKPNAPSGLNQTQNDTIMSLFWTSNGDDKTPKASLSYNVRIGTTPGGRDIVSPHALDDGTLTKAEIGNAQLGTSFKIVGLPAGTYYWSVQAIDHGFKGSDWSQEATFTINSPDLSLSNVNLSANTVTQGGTVNISYVVSNLTSEKAGEHLVNCYLSADTNIILGNVTPIDTYTINSLAGNTSTELITRSITIPGDAVLGERYLVVVVDASEQIIEDDETNNQNNLPITITEAIITYPDLALSSVSLDVSSTTPGGTVKVNYIVDNASSENAGAHVVNCYLSTDNAFNEANDNLLDSYNITSLSANTSTALISRQLTIPSDATISEQQIFVVVDASKTVIESNENNNMASRTLNITEHTSHALTFDGIDDNVLVPAPGTNNFNINRELTFESWVKPTSYPAISIWSTLIEAGDNFRIYMDHNGDIKFHSMDNIGNAYDTGTENSALTLNEWHHIAIVRENDNTVDIYINGTLEISSTDGQLSDATIENFIIGGDLGNAQQLTGLIDEVRIWNTVRTQQEIYNNLNNYLNGSEPGLVAYYQFNEGSGQTVTDLSVNGYHGTLGPDALASSNDPIWTKTNWPYFSPKPDLTVIEQSLDNTTLTANTSTNANCRIANIGDGNADASVVQFYLSSDDILDDGTDTQLTSANVAAINANDSSLVITKNITIPNGTTEGNYYIMFKADGGNTLDESNEDNNFAAVAIQIEKEITAPAAPTGLSVATVSSSEVSLSWTDNADNEDGFEISRSLSGTGGFEVIDSVATDVTSYNDVGLLTNTEYYYTVRAYNIAGYSDDSNVSAATTDNTAPNAPTDLLAEAGSKTRIDLNWTDIADNEDGFKVYRSATSGGTATLVATLAANVTSYSNEDLQPETTYYFKVCAFNNIDEACTSEVSATTLSNLTPDVNNASCCFGENIPDLTATGENIKWYSDSGLSNNVGNGNSFSTNQTNPGEYKYYVTQTKDGTESDPAVAVLTIHKLPDVSAGDNFEGCSSGLNLNGSNPTGVGRWSIISGIGNIEDDLNPNSGFSSNETTPVVLRYTVTDEHQCVNYDEVTITLKESPAEPNIHLKGGFIYICTNADMAGYQWYRDNIAISGANKQFYVADQAVSGTYAVEITNEQGCSNKAAHTNKSVSLSLDETVNLFPVPFNEIIKLEINNKYTGNIKARITDFNGREILNQTLIKTEFIEQYSFSTHRLEAGFYMMSFTFPDNKTVYKRIVKN